MSYPANCKRFMQLLSCGVMPLHRSSNHRSIKLFLIGDGERGKTSLLRRLKQEEKKVDNRTIGIDIRKWSYPKGKKKNDKTVDFLIWDFAGQVCNYTLAC